MNARSPNTGQPATLASDMMVMPVKMPVKLQMQMQTRMKF